MRSPARRDYDRRMASPSFVRKMERERVRLARRRNRRPVDASALAMGLLLLLLSAFPLGLATMAGLDIPTHRDPANLAAMCALVAMIGLGAASYGLACVSYAFRAGR